ILSEHAQTHHPLHGVTLRKGGRGRPAAVSRTDETPDREREIRPPSHPAPPQLHPGEGRRESQEIPRDYPQRHHLRDRVSAPFLAETVGLGNAYGGQRRETNRRRAS